MASSSLHRIDDTLPAENSSRLSTNTARVASRAWITLLRPVVQLVVAGLLWSTSVLLAASEEDERGGVLLHPLLMYLVPAGLGSMSVWFALD